MSVAMVCMVNNTAIHNSNDQLNESQSNLHEDCSLAKEDASHYEVNSFSCS